MENPPKGDIKMLQGYLDGRRRLRVGKYRIVYNLMEILPESEQNLAFEFIKRLVLAWDPDFTRLTPAEREEIEGAMEEIENGEIVSHEEIDWA